MSDPNVGYIVVRGGIVEQSPDHMPVFDMDTLDGQADPDDIEEVRSLRARIDALVDELSESSDHDVAYLTSLVAECDSWLFRNDPTSRCGNCGEPIKRDDNGAGQPIRVHLFGSTVCHDDPPGSMDGDVLHPATPAN